MVNKAGIVGMVIQAVPTVIEIAKPHVENLLEKRKNNAELQKQKIAVPPLYAKGYPLTTAQAIEVLENRGLKAMLVATTLPESNALYNTCFNNQVIGSAPKAKEKVEPGMIIKVKYITQEVINESHRLFEEQEEIKKQKAIDKELKQSERKAKLQSLKPKSKKTSDVSDEQSIEEI